MVAPAPPSSKKSIPKAAMRASTSHLRPLIEAAPILLWAAGPDKRCMFFSKRWLEYTGRTLEEQLGHEWIESLHAEDQSRCASAYSAAFSQREEFQFECRLLRADGDYRWMIANGAPRFGPSGAFAGFVGTFTDIHELGLSTTGREAGVRRLSSIGTLAAGIAHDFNNLLANILANAELALKEVPSRSRATGELQRIRMVAVRGSEIVRELMVYAGQEQARAEAVDLSKLVEEMLEMLRISISKHAAIVTDLATNLPPVLAEPAEMRELLMNLILNASDALAEKDGEIRISTSHTKGAAADRAERGTNLAGECVRIVVADTGPGIPASTRSRIFDPFVTTKHPGRGVGLAIVRTITRKYGGSVRFTSSPGKGTRFIVLLPCSVKQFQQSEEETLRDSSPAEPGAGRTILIVDDEEGLRLAVSQLLRRDGFRVIEARDGSSAVELLRTHRQTIDAILLDLTIPGVPSDEVIEQAVRVRPNIRIFLTSAYSRGNGAAAFKAPQVKGFIRKPYQIRDLVQVLAEDVYVKSASGNAQRR